MKLVGPAATAVASVVPEFASVISRQFAVAAGSVPAGKTNRYWPAPLVPSKNTEVLFEPIAARVKARGLLVIVTAAHEVSPLLVASVQMRALGVPEPNASTWPAPASLSVPLHAPLASSTSIEL